jgi:hypothetical protein
MKHLIALALIAAAAQATIPLPAAPSWSSSDHDYSTGGAWADVNGDGLVDLLTSNGNDMALDSNGVYLNSGGTLETVASWRSADAGYFGHCYAGDVDNDGDIDLAVAYLGAGSSGDFRARIYRNEGGTLSALPWWQSDDQHSSFDCCLGDVDMDGDLDLCISAGDAYQGEVDSVRIYRNNGGVFEPLPFWTANEGTASDAVRFADVDDDGDLDLFVGHRGKVTMFRNNAGTLDPNPAWTARRGVGWVLRLAIGDYDRDHLPDLAVACNDQLGDPNGIFVYHNDSGTLDTLPAFAMQRQGSALYGSCVAWGDFNGDMQPDLAAGGWWRPVVVYEGRPGGLDTIPAWSWSPPNRYDLVCEAVAVADARNATLVSIPEVRAGDGVRKLWQLGNLPLQSIDSVTVDGARVPVAGWCADPLAGWVSLAAAPPSGSAVCFYYRLSVFPDLAVTNWDRGNGNHLFLNTSASGIAAPTTKPPAALVAAPGIFADRTTLLWTGAPPDRATAVTVSDLSGRRVYSASVGSFPFTLDLSPLPPGVYFAAVGDRARIKLVKADR